jgi:hypothetical protein
MLCFLSAASRDECAQHGLPYFEAAVDLEETVTRVVGYLVEGERFSRKCIGDQCPD